MGEQSIHKLSTLYGGKELCYEHKWLYVG